MKSWLIINEWNCWWINSKIRICHNAFTFNIYVTQLQIGTHSCHLLTASSNSANSNSTSWTTSGFVCSRSRSRSQWMRRTWSTTRSTLPSSTLLLFWLSSSRSGPMIRFVVHRDGFVVYWYAFVEAVVCILKLLGILLCLEVYCNAFKCITVHWEEITVHWDVLQCIDELNSVVVTWKCFSTVLREVELSQKSNRRNRSLPRDWRAWGSQKCGTTVRRTRRGAESQWGSFVVHWTHNNSKYCQFVFKFLNFSYLVIEITVNICIYFFILTTQ